MLRRAFTLIELLVVITVIGALGAMVLPKLTQTLHVTKARMNEATMKDVKRAAVLFAHDVGFMPDNVTLLTLPYEQCDVADTNYDNDANSSTCKLMIVFTDSRLSLDEPYRDTAQWGDYGFGTLRKASLIAEIARRLDPKQNGWRGNYIGGNAHLDADYNQTHGDGADTQTRYYLSEKDIDLYYHGFDRADTLVDIGMDEETRHRLYPIFADFNGSRNGAGTQITADHLYDVAKYRDRLIGELTVLDPWGTPYELQFPIVEGASRERFARLVSFGPNRLRDTDAESIDIEYNSQNYDDSVLYLYENNRSNHFYSGIDE